ncbi:endolytic transglycosylase MltG [Gammaproteobacteria bacterium]|nr:endolytic transglycosylase MltG [Gammaproteobacteria bacterium]
MRRRLFFAMLGLAATLVVVAVVAVVFGRQMLNERLAEPRLDQGETLRFEMVRGDTLDRLAQQLAAADVIDDPRWLKVWARVENRGHHLQAGHYALEAPISAIGAVEAVERGEVVSFKAQLIEGHTFRQALKRIQQADDLSIQSGGLSDAEILAEIGASELHPEGLFFADTYRYTVGDSDIALLRRAYQRLKTVLDEEWQQRRSDLPLASPYDALILASIIEKESGLADERPRIAGVFINRLKVGMRLQTDPTVIYGLGDRYDGNIRRVDLKTDTPWNTYTRDGLPPTPIALVGREAIRAALQPEDTDAYYFVAVGDGSGAHTFSRTLAEHNRAVRQYLKNTR